MLLVTVGYSASRSYTLKKTLAEGESSSSYSYYQFPSTSFVNDTIEYGDTVTFNMYVDYNKHVPVAPVLSVLFQKTATTDSLKVTKTIYYSQTAALANDNLGTTLEPFYYTSYKARSSVLNFSSATYYPVVIADSILSTGFAYPNFSFTRSALYKVVIIPLKAANKVKVKDIRFKLYLTPAQFK